MSPSSQQKQRKPEEVKAIKYRGRLNAAQAAAGINAALRNAKRLLTDATLLFQSGSYATAAALAVLRVQLAHALESLAHLHRDVTPR